MWRTRITLTALTLASSVLSFCAYTLFLRHLGASEAVDRLFYAASVPLSVAGVMSGVLLYLLPGKLARISARAQDSALTRVMVIAAGATVVAVLLGGLMLLLRPDVRFWALGTGFTLTAGLQIAATLGVCLAQTRSRYLSCGIAPLLASVGLISGVLLAIFTGREWWLLMGQLTGTATAVCWLARALSLRLRFGNRRDWAVAAAVFAPLRPHALAIGMGTTAFTLFQPIDAALCAELGAGAMTIMAYAQRVLVALSTAVSLGTYTVAARASYDALRTGDPSVLRRQANRESVRIILCGLAVWLAYELVGKMLLSILLSSSSMVPEDGARLADTLSWMLLGLGPMAAMPYLFRVFYAMDDYRRPAILGICVAPLYGLLGWSMLGSLQVVGLAIGYCIAWWLVFAATMLCLNGVPVRLPSRRFAD